MDAVIGALSRAVGVPTPITDLPREAVPDGVADELLARGQRLCPVADDKMPLLEESIGSSVAASGLAAAEIKHVILATETMTISESWAVHEQVRGRVRDGDPRVLPPALSAIGDGVASCVVMAAGTGWRLNWLLRRAFLAGATHRPAEDFGPTWCSWAGHSARCGGGHAVRSAATAIPGVVSGPAMSSGYYGNPAGTAQLIRDGWIRTGDLARRDAEGRFWIVGRRKDVVLKSLLVKGLRWVSGSGEGWPIVVGPIVVSWVGRWNDGPAAGS